MILVVMIEENKGPSPKESPKRADFIIAKAGSAAITQPKA